MGVQLKLVFAVALIFFFLLFRVWPDWLKQGMWYVSWYTLVFLVVTAIVRAIVWFAIFHIGIDFWIFPNYFIDSDNILDSFWPLLSCDKREDMFDFRMLIVRVVSAIAIAYGVQEFMADPENLEQVMGGGQEIWDEMYDWGHHKFMGTVDPNQQIEVKKSARQIYAEAFMEDENPMFRTNTHFANVADDDASPPFGGDGTTSPTPSIPLAVKSWCQASAAISPRIAESKALARFDVALMINASCSASAPALAESAVVKASSVTVVAVAVACRCSASAASAP